MFSTNPHYENLEVAKVMNELDTIIHDYYDKPDELNRIGRDMFATYIIKTMKQEEYKLPFTLYYFRRTRYD